MNRPISMLAILLSTLLLSRPLAAQNVALSGALYQYRPGQQKPAPLAGVRVFVYSGSTRRWTGPVLTDTFGRFAFYGLKSGAYILDVFDGTTKRWEQEVQVPGALPPIVLR